MKYNIGDIILTTSSKHLSTEYNNKVGIILEIYDKATYPTYRVLLCGLEKEIWINNKQVKKVLYKKE